MSRLEIAQDCTAMEATPVEVSSQRGYLLPKGCSAILHSVFVFNKSLESGSCFVCQTCEGC